MLEVGQVLSVLARGAWSSSQYATMLTTDYFRRLPRHFASNSQVRLLSLGSVQVSAVPS